ncbi:hypothetical protein SLEP1_g42319 [Rubroshorea leprosula]|uniref:Derlin n=1 Tax=Rubroshorea leprosula TaxID=152421 RepID=A0AAV5L9V0_9ROSI|nr:hypothetical protein SLEP1_g42319 [Rubroshorea leprosula]
MSTPGDADSIFGYLKPIFSFQILSITATYEQLLWSGLFDDHWRPHLGLYDSDTTALYFEGVFIRFQVWRLITNFFFIAPFSLRFAFVFMSIAEYSVSLERGPFDKRTAD